MALYERENGDFDVAVLDIMMPGAMDGLAVCQELRRENSSIGIILLSARTQEMDKVSGLMMGADDYVTKPFSPSELVARGRGVPAGGFGCGEEREQSPGRAAFRRVCPQPAQPFLPEVRKTCGAYPGGISDHGIFLFKPGVALSRGDILKHVWGAGYGGRKKLWMSTSAVCA